MFFILQCGDYVHCLCVCSNWRVCDLWSTLQDPSSNLPFSAVWSCDFKSAIYGVREHGGRGGRTRSLEWGQIVKGRPLSFKINPKFQLESLVLYHVTIYKMSWYIVTCLRTSFFCQTNPFCLLSGSVLGHSWHSFPGQMTQHQFWFTGQEENVLSFCLLKWCLSPKWL